MTNYSVRTSFGMTYNYIVSWKEWDIDKSFLVLNRNKEDDFVIIKKQDVLSIYKN